MNNYFAAVDKSGDCGIFSREKPIRQGNIWNTNDGRYMDLPTDTKGFPNITWDDEPKLVRLIIEVVG